VVASDRQIQLGVGNLESAVGECSLRAENEQWQFVDWP
jgi:hypothetical protein